VRRRGAPLDGVDLSAHAVALAVEYVGETTPQQHRQRVTHGCGRGLASCMVALRSWGDLTSLSPTRARSPRVGASTAALCQPFTTSLHASWCRVIGRIHPKRGA
jgi:hypothetical protein